jgi:hypothetical protein
MGRAFSQKKLKPRNSRMAIACRRAYTSTRFWLIGTEVFAATALLVVTGLLDQACCTSSTSVAASPPDDFSAEVDVDGDRCYNEPASRAAFDDQILRRLRMLPGVHSAGMVSAMWLSGEDWLDGVSRTDRPDSDSKISNYRWISPDYLSTACASLC